MGDPTSIQETPARDAPRFFTAAAIARVLRCSSRSVRRALASVTPDLDRAGSRAWRFESLPDFMRNRLASIAEQQGFRNAVAALAFDESNARWQPNAAVPECSDDTIEKAGKLRTALRHAIEIAMRLGPASRECIHTGCTDFEAVFGYHISERHCRRLVLRTLERAATGWPVDSIEIYLPNNPRRRHPQKRLRNHAAGSEGCPEEADPREFDWVNSSFNDPNRISSSEMILFWDRACSWLRDAIDQGDREKLAKERLFEHLTHHLGAIFPSRNALRVRFDRKWRRWRSTESPEALVDQRAAANARRARVLPDQERDQLIYLAVTKHRGRISPAARELWPEASRGRKSYVPQRIREAVASEIEALLPYQQGPRASDKALPHMDLSHEGIRPMDAIVADDVTFNSYMWVPSEDGATKLTRGQVILVADFCSRRVLGFGLIPEEQPNSLLAWGVITRAIREFGVPKVLVIERGRVFRDSRLVGGAKGSESALPRNAWQPIPEEEREIGLRSLGIRIITARRARSKPIERIIGQIQDLMNAEPGYAGRDERRDRPEELTRQMRLVRSGEAHPSKFFYSLEQWQERIFEIISEYNRTPQEGRMLKGASPDSAFRDRWNESDPPTRLDEESQHLLANHRRACAIRGGAVSFTLRGERHSYRHENLSPMEGKSALVWINPEDLRFVTVTDLKHRNPVTVPRCENPNALAILADPDDQTLASETAKVRRFDAHWKTRFRTLKAAFDPRFRINVVSKRTSDLGKAISDQQQAAAVSSERMEASRHRGTRRLAALGLSPSTVANEVDIDSASKGIAERLRAAIEEDEKEDA